MLTFDEAHRRWTVVLKEDPTVTVSILKQRAIFDDVCQRGLRSVCWKIYLGYLETLDASKWMLSLEKERQHYEQLRKTYIVDPNTTNGDGNESGVRKIVEHHPLSLDEASPWGQFFQDTELRRIIKQDVERTFPDNPYFRTPVTQERMTDILFVYCKIHNDVSYRQGMHELLAPILLVVDHDALDPEECTDAAEPEIAKQMAITLDKNFVEHDAFVLFSSVMGTAKQWYEFTEEPRRSSANRVQLVSPRSAKFEQRNEMANSSTPILRISHRIHHELLKTIDNDLYEHLEELAIEPQIYAIRWLRLLFGREFPLADVYCLWDALFADDRSLSAVEYVCIAMLLFIREELLSEDYSGCLHQLMRYPTISDITVFVKQAVHLRQNPTKEAGYDIRHRNAIREGKEEEWKEREAQRERARLQEIEKQQVQDPRQQIKREVSNVVGKIRDKVSIVASNVVAASSPTRLSSDPNTSPVMSHSSSHSDSNIHSILSSSAPHPRHATLSNSGGIPQRKSSHTSLNASVSLAQPKMGRIVARSIAIIERELYGNNHTEKQKTEEPKKIEEKEMKTPILLAKDEETDANNGTADKDEPDEETDGYRVPGTEEPSDESQDPQVQLIIALAGLKHVRDVLCGTAPEFDSTVLDNLEDDWVDLMEEKETAKTERLSMDNGQSGNVQESVGEDGGDMLSLSLSSTTQTNVDTLVGSAETSTDSKSPPNISQEPKEAAQTTKPAKEKPASSKETNKKKSIDLQKENAPTGKRTGKSTAITSPVRSRVFSVEEIIAETAPVPSEQSKHEQSLASDAKKTNPVAPTSPSASADKITSANERIKRVLQRTPTKPKPKMSSNPRATVALGEQVSVDPLGALMGEPSPILPSSMRKSPSVHSARSAKSTASTKSKRLTADQLAQMADLDDSTNTATTSKKTGSASTTASVKTVVNKTATTAITSTNTVATKSPTSSTKEPKRSVPPVTLPPESTDPLNTVQVSRKSTGPKLDPKLAKVIKRTPKYRSTDAIMKEMARWEKNAQGESSEEEEDEDTRPIGHMGIDTRHIDPSRIGRPLVETEDNSDTSSFALAADIGAGAWNEEFHHGVKMVGPPLPPTDLAPEISAGEWANHTPEPEVSTATMAAIDIPDFAADALGWSAAEDEDEEEEQEERNTFSIGTNERRTSEASQSFSSRALEEDYVFASAASTASLHSITSIPATISPTTDTFSPVENNDLNGFSMPETIGGAAPWHTSDMNHSNAFATQVHQEEEETTTHAPPSSYHITNNMESEWNPWS